MKRNNIYLLTLVSIFGLTTLTGCGYVYNDSLFPPGFNSSESVESDNQESTTEIESENSSSEELSETPSISKSLIGFNVIDNHYYSIGDIYSSKAELEFVALYSDGTSESYNSNLIKNVHFADIDVKPNGYDKYIKYNPTDQIEYPGLYNVKVQIDSKYISFYTFEVLEGLDDNRLAVTGLEVELDNVAFSKNEILSDTLSATLHIKFSNGGLETIVYNKYTKHLYPTIHVGLYAEGNDNDNLISNPLQPSVNYTLDISVSTFNYSKSFFIEPGYLKLDEPSFVTSDFDKEAVPSTGEAKVFVVPIFFSFVENPFEDNTLINQLKGYIDEYGFDEYASTLSIIYNYYFMDTEAIIPSMHTYFKKSSFNQLNIGGTFGAPRLDLINYDFSKFLQNDNEELFYDFLQECLDYAIKNPIDINTGEIDNNFNYLDYDSNNDGQIDIVHFVTNINNLAISKDSCFYPQSGHAKDVETSQQLKVGKYYISTFKYLTDLEVALETKKVGILEAIKDVGACLGLPDYDNKTNDEYDHNYVGHAELMSTGILDLNSFSKLANGWMKPYVIDGESDEVDIKIRSFSTTGDCIIVPANYSTYNGSAYDEYFLIEFFTADGNNKNFLDIYNIIAPEEAEKLDGETHGIRIHHVDARLVKKNIDNTYSPAEYQKGAEGEWVLPINNTANYYDYKENTVYEEWADHKLICTIQKNKSDTFGQGGRTFLAPSDLFFEGDTFAFEDYDHFLSKKGEARTTMDNGEIFPFCFEVIEDNSNFATIRITKK